MTYHPWHLLKESIKSSFPDETQLIAMKKVMDGETKIHKKDLIAGMKTAGLKNLNQLILWGLRQGIIQDAPIPFEDKISTARTYEGHPSWLRLLNHIVTGKSEREIEQDDMSKDSINFYKNLIKQKYNLGPSDAKLIRFAYAMLNPISPPPSVKSWRTPEMTKDQTILLRLLAQGYNLKEIADMMGVSQKTTSYHFLGLKKSFGITSHGNAAIADLTQRALKHSPDLLKDRPRNIDTINPDQLSPQQLAILKLFAKGLNTYQIGDILKISPKTAEYHRAKLFNALHIFNISDLTAFAVKHGLTDES